MKTTYEEDVKKLNIKAEDFDNTLSYIMDKSAEEMIALAKIIKNDSIVCPVVKRAFERVLDMRDVERIEAYNIYYS